MHPSSTSVQEQEARFRQWLADHAGLIWKTVRAFADQPADQDDLFQQILLQLWSSIPAFRGEARETTWIYRVAFNTAMSWRRGEKRRRESHIAYVELSTPLRPEMVHPGSTEESALVEQLYAAIRHLPKTDATLALMHLDGVSYAEMAEVLGISENHVGVKLTRLRKQLAETLKGASDEL